MNTIVCIKQVVDPEAPPAAFKVDAASNRMVLAASIPPVLDPYSEYALEAALRIKDAHGGRVTAISLGTGLLRDIVKKSLSMGADELILLEDEAFADGDSWSTVYALAAAIRRIGSYDLILCGRQAADWDAGQVGSGIAEMLDLPSVTVARKIDISDGKIVVERVTSNGYEVIEASLPAVVTVSSELGKPRYPTIRGIMAAKKKEPLVWQSADIGLRASQVGAAGRRSRLVRLFQPLSQVECQLIDGETPEEAGVNLAQKLREAKLL
ncbi:MAG: electron transfer flavoprotein subunit beta/FixA family protein [Dehalococcoidales bacterium]